MLFHLYSTLLIPRGKGTHLPVDEKVGVTLLPLEPRSPYYHLCYHLDDVLIQTGSSSEGKHTDQLGQYFLVLLSR